MNKTNIQMTIVIVVAAVIAVVFSVPYLLNVMGALIAEIGWLPLCGIFVGFSGVFYGIQKIEKILSYTKYRY